MSKHPFVKTGNTPLVKLTKASVVSYSASTSSKNGVKAVTQAPCKRNHNNYNDNNSSPCKGCLKPSVKLPDDAGEDVEFFQSRVGALRKKLEEANSNICTLRAFVVNTIDQINNQGKPKGAVETAEEIKQLLVILEEVEDQNNVVMERGMECIKIVEDLESTDCKCGPTTPSVEAIRRELLEINQEQIIVNEKIDKEKGDTVSKVHQSCSIVFCPRKPTNAIATGTQLCCPGPEHKPKILQTDTKYNISVGTNPSGLTSSSKGQTAKLKCNCAKGSKLSCY